MNKVTFKVLFALLFIGNLMVVDGQCLPNGITFNTQQQIDNFPTNYPGCTEILGDIEITGAITNLNGLSQIVIVGGLVNIHNTSLINLEGLNNLNTIGEDFIIFNNSSIQNTDGIENLQSIKGELNISGNSSLSEITSFENITSLGDGIFPTDALKIVSNIMVTNIQSLSNLETLNGDCQIKSTSLVNLNALSNVQTISGKLEIVFNGILTNIDGLQSINPNEIEYLRIAQNQFLSNCDINSICEYLNMPDRSVEIQQNYTGCSSITQVEAACALGTKENELSDIKIFPNPTNGTFEISGLESGTVRIIDSQGRTVKQRNLGQANYSISELTSGIYFIKITSENYSVIKQLIKI
jgi:hypothetical protein